jgi:rRNA processing protein Gar1
MDMEDYEVLMRLVGRLAEMQGPVADPHGLVSKVLRVSVKIGLRELVSRVGQG